MSKLLTVFGSTGAQGGALIDYVLKSPSLSSIYRLRGVTRDVSKASAIALKDKGVDMVQVGSAALNRVISKTNVYESCLGGYGRCELSWKSGCWLLCGFQYDAM